MKKGLKALSSLLIALLVALQIVPAVGAQESDVKTILQEINQANAEVTSMSGDGFVSLAMVSNEQRADLGQLNYDFSYNVDPRFGLEAHGEVVSPFIGEALGFDLFYENAVGYLFDGTAWQAQDFSAEEKEISDAFYQALNEMSGMEETPEAQASLDLNEKYTDFEETDTEYVFSLKQNINADELWADLNSVVDLNAVKEEAIQQAETEAGQELDQETKDMIDSMYSADVLDVFLKTNPVFTTHYDKETLRLTKMAFEFQINLADFVPADVAAEEDMSAMPQVIIVAGEMNFANYGEQFDIAVPQEAIDSLVPTETETPTETDTETEDGETTDESVEETIEDVVEESAEETETTEETTEETVEESTEDAE